MLVSNVNGGKGMGGGRVCGYVRRGRRQTGERAEGVSCVRKKKKGRRDGARWGKGERGGEGDQEGGRKKGRGPMH